MKVRLEGGEFTPDERNDLFTTAVFKTHCHKTKHWGKNLCFKKKKRGGEIILLGISKVVATMRTSGVLKRLY